MKTIPMTAIARIIRPRARGCCGAGCSVGATNACRSKSIPDMLDSFNSVAIGSQFFPGQCGEKPGLIPGGPCRSDTKPLSNLLRATCKPHGFSERRLVAASALDIYRRHKGLVTKSWREGPGSVHEW